MLPLSPLCVRKWGAPKRKSSVLKGDAANNPEVRRAAAKARLEAPDQEGSRGWTLLRKMAATQKAQPLKNEHADGNPDVGIDVRMADALEGAQTEELPQFEGPEGHLRPAAPPASSPAPEHLLPTSWRSQVPTPEALAAAALFANDVPATPKAVPRNHRRQALHMVAVARFQRLCCLDEGPQGHPRT